jgi:hypothetical protein
MSAYDPTTKRYRAACTCPDCGRERTVIATFPGYPTGTRCRSCSNKARPHAPRPNQKTGETVACEECGDAFYRRQCERGRRFCSRRCHDESRRVYPVERRSCLACGTDFDFSPKPASNTTGHYCSLACRNRAYLGTYKGRPAFGWRGHRPGWRSIANRIKAEQGPACARCGRLTRRNAVHHIEPYRARQNNEPWNLIVLCPRCHCRTESASDRVETLPPPCRMAAVHLIRSMIRGDSRALSFVASR